MPETKFGVSQLSKPAPLFYRRFTNAMLIFFLPGYVAVIQALPMSDKTRNILMLVATAIPFLLKGIGVMLGNGQDFVPSNEAIDDKKSSS